MADIPHISPGDPITASYLNALAGAIGGAQFIPGDGDTTVTSPLGVSGGLARETEPPTLLKIHSLFDLGRKDVRLGIATINAVASTDPYTYAATVQWLDGETDENATVKSPMLAHEPYVEGSVLLVTTRDIQ